MSSDLVRFGELFLTPQKNGLTRPRKVRGSGVPMVNMGELFAHPRIRNLEMDRVPLAAAEAGFLLAPGDLLFARQSLVLAGAGQCSLFLGNTEPTTFESHLIRCRLDRKRADPTFYFYFFRSQDGRRTIEAIVEQGAGASGIRGSDLVNVQVPCPPLSVQNEVAATLGALDDRIALLRETNATLEAIAQALFKSWFIDFDPVRAKSQGLAPAGMDEATAALFPDGFEESERGPVPRGWHSGSLADLMSMQGGTQPPASEFKDLPSDGYVRLLQIRDYAVDNHLTFIPRTGKIRLVGEDDVLIERYGSGSGDREKDSLGRLLRGLEGAINVAIVKVLPSMDIYREWIGQYVASGAFYRAIVGGSSRAVQAGFRQDDLPRIQLSIAPDAVYSAFDEFARVVWSRSKEFRRQIGTLTALRDTLLPRLISGQLRLPQAEEAIAEATHAD